ncbi:hypothetical protein K7J14_03140 [Treponema zuelzerae]|uniref:DUF560 domain-containing protein n=1 Tax=Teretinema zuelzerae TaxID=156 RepID=A0AAE3EFU0_9SPIR|nr:hypothetical protein [Teretinema zuelzerae]MCD1653692.1 hypothetical protein [Teretinema zuelzerae]
MVRSLLPFAAAWLFASALSPLAAEIVPSARLEANASIPSAADGSAADFAGIARISLDSAKNDAIKGRVSFSLADTSGSKPVENQLALEQAWIKTRFPWITENSSLRLTAGKAPLSWGRGFLYNAGDPVFGAVPETISPGTGEYRTATDWLASLYLPLGDFSFAEFLALPYENAGAGARLFFTPELGALHSIEASYLAREAETVSAAHTASLSADGTIWADWYASASLSAPFETSPAPENMTGRISGGVFRMFSPPAVESLSFRLEALYIPASLSDFENAHLYGYASIQTAFDELWSVAAQTVITRTAGIGAGEADTAENRAVFFPKSTIASLIVTFTPIKGFSMNTGMAAMDMPSLSFDDKGLVYTLGFTASF